MPRVGLEPTHLAAGDFESPASTNFATWAACEVANYTYLPLFCKIYRYFFGLILFLKKIIFTYPTINLSKSKKYTTIQKIFQPTRKMTPAVIFCFCTYPIIMMTIQTILEKTLPGLGYELVDFELTAQGILRVFIDKETGITVEDCATVSNHLSRVFMVEDIDYKHLEISSPGLDRPLKKASDFIRFSGSLIKLKTRLPVDGQKNFIGRITNFDPNSEIITLSFDSKTANIELNNVDKARIKPEFKF